MSARQKLVGLLGLAILIGIVGCASVGVTVVKQATAKPDSCHLDIYTAESEIKRPYEAVCLIDTQKKAWIGESSIADAIAASKPAACSCGADAILVLNGGVQSANAFNYGSATTVIRAIQYK